MPSVLSSPFTHGAATAAFVLALTASCIIDAAPAAAQLNGTYGTDSGACDGRTLEHTPTGQTVAWHNPQNGAQYRVTPTGNFQGNNGQPCRNFTTQAVIDGRNQDVEGTACRQPDGSWKTVDATGAADAMGPDTVFKVQQKLHDQGFYVRDNIDGRWGPKTSAAVQNYQRANGLQASGQLDQPTLAALGLAPSSQQAQAAAPPSV